MLEYRYTGVGGLTWGRECSWVGGGQLGEGKRERKGESREENEVRTIDANERDKAARETGGVWMIV